MPGAQPCGVGHPHAEPGGPGGWAQHQKYWVKQMVPGVWGGTCAQADGIGTKPKPSPTTRTILRTRTICFPLPAQADAPPRHSALHAKTNIGLQYFNIQPY